MAENKKLLGVIIAALIGVLGVIYQANKIDPVRVPEFEASLEVQKTQTAQATEIPPSTTTSHAPGIDTPLPIPTVDIARWHNAGNDWQQSCISSKIWQMYPNTLDLAVDDPEGCYNLISYGITAHQGNLAFVRSRVRSLEVYGILVPIPDNANISFDLRINHIENAEVWIGIAKDPKTLAGKYLNGKAGSNFEITTVPQNIRNYLSHSENYYESTEPNLYHFEYSLQGNLWDVYYQGSPAAMFDNKIINFSPRYLFLGFRAYPENGLSGSIDTRISNLEIEAQ